MELKIRDFAKLSQADILIDGITVIAGENNTGKSTIGKILFSLFNTISGIDEKIILQRKEVIIESCGLMLRKYFSHNSSGTAYMRSSFYIANKIASNIIEEQDNEEDVGLDIERIRTIIVEVISKTIEIQDLKPDELDEFNEMIKSLEKKVESILNLSEETIIFEILTRYFNEVFNNQINSLTKRNSKAEVTLEIKGKPINVGFENNTCKKFEGSFSLLNKAIYIDNPYIVDKLDKSESLNMVDGFLKKHITDADENDVMDGIIESVLAKEKLEEIYRTLHFVVDGKIIRQQDNKYYLQKDGYDESIYLGNLSNGLKSFVLLQMLLEKGILEEKDVLILDEPEIHLHPEWQVVYAEIIVLLQKYFDLSIIVTTHSPYFLDAINLYSVKHDIDKKINYYLSSMENDNVNMEFVTDNIDKIYKKMSTPVQILETLRYELNNR